MPGLLPRPGLLALATATVLVAIFGTLVLRFRQELQAQIHQTIIERDAAVLYPVVLHQIAGEPSDGPAERLAAVLRSSGQRGVLAVALFDPDGRPRRAVPADQLFIDLPVEDYLQLKMEHQPISRYHPQFPLHDYFPGLGLEETVAPVLEVLLPLHYEPAGGWLFGFVRFHLDARALAAELATIDARIKRQTAATLAIGAILIGVVVAAASAGLRRAHRAIAERNERLVRANFDLTFAAKASAIGQITSHLLHGLQGPVAGLRATMATAGTTAADESPDWEAARGYTERLQTLVEETVRLLGDAAGPSTYELTGDELAAALRSRSAALAAEHGVTLVVRNTYRGRLDNHRGGLLCLVGHNLIDNAVRATPAAGRVVVELEAAPEAVSLRVSDEGGGVVDSVRTSLFEPGRSGRPGGTGLGLAISRLLTLQLGGELVLKSTGATGTVFELRIPEASA